MSTFNTYLSFTPGPTQLDDRVLNSMSTQVVTHLNEGWGPYYLKVCDKLNRIVGNTGDCFAMCCSGSGGVEAAVVSTIAPGDKLLVLTNGLFGDRFGEIADAYQLDKEVMRFPSQTAISPDALRQRLQQGCDDITAVSVVYSESQTGLLNPIQEIAAVCHEFGKPVMVDMISAVGGVEFNMDEWGVDIAVAAMQKCLGGTVGITCVFVREDAWKYLDGKKTLGYYFSLQFWKKSVHSYIDDPTSGPHPHPFSITETLMVAANEACDQIFEEGLDNRIKRHREVYEYYKRELTALGFRMYQSDENASPACISLYPHSKIGPVDMAARLKNEYGIMVGVGIAEMKNELWRIGNMADQARMYKAVILVNAIRAIIDNID